MAAGEGRLCIWMGSRGIRCILGRVLGAFWGVVGVLDGFWETIGVLGAFWGAEGVLGAFLKDWGNLVHFGGDRGNLVHFGEDWGNLVHFLGNIIKCIVTGKKSALWLGALWEETKIFGAFLEGDRWFWTLLRGRWAGIGAFLVGSGKIQYLSGGNSWRAFGIIISYPHEIWVLFSSNFQRKMNELSDQMFKKNYVHYFTSWILIHENYRRDNIA